MKEHMDINRILLRAERSVAFESPDHNVPWGTRLDNSRNLRFNEKLARLYSPDRERPVSVLDLGCSGGGFVRSLLNAGFFAMGLEGSDYSFVRKRAEWRTIPEHLFTCDISKKFRIVQNNDAQEAPVHFDVVTAWEVVEHLAERELDQLTDNVQTHLAEDGLWIMSVSSEDDMVNGVNLHQTVKPADWWIHFFAERGLHHLPSMVDYFNTQFVRGPKYGALHSFHLVLSPSADKNPAPPREGLTERLYDRWLGSAIQRRLSRWIVGPTDL